MLTSDHCKHKVTSNILVGSLTIYYNAEDSKTGVLIAVCRLSLVFIYISLILCFNYSVRLFFFQCSYYLFSIRLNYIVSALLNFLHLEFDSYIIAEMRILCNSESRNKLEVVGK